MIIFTPNTVIKSADVNLNFADSIDITKQQNPYKFCIYRASNWSATSNTVIPFDTVAYDTNGDTTIASYKWTAPVNGFYQINWGFVSSSGSGIGYHAQLLKNGAYLSTTGGTIAYYTNGGGWQRCTGSGLFQLTAGDYIQAYYIGQNGDTVSGAVGSTYLNGYLVSTT